MMTKRKMIQYLQEEKEMLIERNRNLVKKYRDYKELKEENDRELVRVINELNAEVEDLQLSRKLWKEIGESEKREHFKAFPSKVKEKGRATIVWFPNGDKIVVKKAKGENGDIYTAVAYAICEHIYGNNTQFKKFVDRRVEK